MNITSTKISGLLKLEPTIYGDDRGYFFETFRNDDMPSDSINFIQDNQSLSHKGAIRGLHFQKPPFAQSKLVRVTSGAVFDVAVDLRKNSTTYGDWFGEILSGNNNLQLFIPEGFAHGFITLENETVFQYKCSNYYSPKSEGGILFNDPEININWSEVSGIPENQFLVSKKDLQLPSFNNFNSRLFSKK